MREIHAALLPGGLFETKRAGYPVNQRAGRLRAFPSKCGKFCSARKIKACLPKRKCSSMPLRARSISMKRFCLRWSRVKLCSATAIWNLASPTRAMGAAWVKTGARGKPLRHRALPAGCHISVPFGSGEGGPAHKKRQSKSGSPGAGGQQLF